MPRQKNRKNIYIVIILILVGLVIFSFAMIFSSGTIKEEKEPNEVKTLPDGTKYIVNPSELLRGAPKGGIGVPGGIPSITEPKFESSPDWLKDEDLVLGLDYNGVVKAYPLKILNWHEIVNDFAGDKPVLITYCPLCRTGIAYKRSINGEAINFGVSGKLFNANLVMYDQKTESYWSQATGQAIVGPLSGRSLERIQIYTTSWRNWKNVYPNTLVLSLDTGFNRDYFLDPYGGWETDRAIGFGVEFKDDQLHPKEIVYGVSIGNDSKAYWEKYLKNASFVIDEVGEQKIALIWDEELGTARIFKLSENVSEVRKLSINEIENKYEEIDSFGLYWFAWLAFNLDTKLVKQHV